MKHLSLNEDYFTCLVLRVSLAATRFLGSVVLHFLTTPAREKCRRLALSIKWAFRQVPQ
jgi:hypothetical protein